LTCLIAILQAKLKVSLFDPNLDIFFLKESQGSEIVHVAVAADVT